MTDNPTDPSRVNDAGSPANERAEPKLSPSGKSAMRGDTSRPMENNAQVDGGRHAPTKDEENEEVRQRAMKDGEPPSPRDSAEPSPLPRPWRDGSTMVGRPMHRTDQSSPGKEAMQGLDQNVPPAPTETDTPEVSSSHQRLTPNEKVVREAEERRRTALEKDIIQSKEEHRDQVRLEALKKGSPSEIDIPAAPSDATQIQEATLSLKEMEALKPENWEQMSEGGRLDMLTQVEARMAAIQRRPPVGLEATQMKPGEFGAFDPKTGLININSAALHSNDVAEHTDTVVHEGRHAYQAFAIKTPGFHSDQQQVASWAQNFEHYKSANVYGQEEYLKQPIEADAWPSAGTIRQAVFGAV